MMNKKYFLLLLMFFAFLLTSIQPAISAETKTLVSLADSHVSDVNPTSNYGGQSFLQVSDSGNMFTGKNLAFLKFDLSQIPSSASIKSAKLRLYTAVYVTSTHAISVHYSSDSAWTETGITYNTQPSFSATPLGTVDVASASIWYGWTVTSTVQSTFQGADKKLTLILKSSYHDSADWVWFESKDQQYSWMEEYRPQLVVSYDIPTEPIDATIGVAAFIAIILIVGGVAFLLFINSRKSRTPSHSKTLPVPPTSENS